MSLATLDRTRPTPEQPLVEPSVHAVPLRAPDPDSVPVPTVSDQVASGHGAPDHGAFDHEAHSQRRLRAVPEGTEARGFVLYVGLDETKAAAAGTDLATVVQQLRALAAQLVPAADTHAAVALAPAGVGGRDVDVVRLALQDPSALAKHRQHAEPETEVKRAGVIIDLTRKRLLLDEESAGLTYKEFELLQYLVLREGRTIDRAELISSLWSDIDDEVPNERTIDVHVRRLRSKLGAYEDIVRTVRGVGYRFDRHADVSVRYASTPSPDLY